MWMRAIGRYVKLEDQGRLYPEGSKNLVKKSTGDVARSMVNWWYISQMIRGYADVADSDVAMSTDDVAVKRWCGAADGQSMGPRQADVHWHMVVKCWCRAADVAVWCLALVEGLRLRKINFMTLLGFDPSCERLLLLPNNLATPLKYFSRLYIWIRAHGDVMVGLPVASSWMETTAKYTHGVWERVSRLFRCLQTGSWWSLLDDQDSMWIGWI